MQSRETRASVTSPASISEGCIGPWRHSLSCKTEDHKSTSARFQLRFWPDASASGCCHVHDMFGKRTVRERSRTRDPLKRSNCFWRSGTSPGTRVHYQRFFSIQKQDRLCARDRDDLGRLCKQFARRVSLPSPQGRGPIASDTRSGRSHMQILSSLCSPPTAWGV